MLSSASLVGEVENRFRYDDLTARRDHKHSSAKTSYYDDMHDASRSYRKYTSLNTHDPNTARAAWRHAHSSDRGMLGVLSRHKGRAEMAATSLNDFRADLSTMEQQTPLARSTSATTRAASRIVHGPVRSVTASKDRSAERRRTDMPKDKERNLRQYSANLRARLEAKTASDMKTNSHSHAEMLAHPGYSFVDQSGHVTRTSPSVPGSYSPARGVIMAERGFNERMTGTSVSPNLLVKTMSGAYPKPRTSILPDKRSQAPKGRASINVSAEHGKVLMKAVHEQHNMERLNVIRDEQEERNYVATQLSVERTLYKVALCNAIEGRGMTSVGDAMSIIDAHEQESVHGSPRRRTSSRASSPRASSSSPRRTVSVSERQPANRSVLISQSSRNRLQAKEQQSYELRDIRAEKVNQKMALRASSRQHISSVTEQSTEHLQEGRMMDRREQAMALNDLLQTRNYSPRAT